MTYSRLLVISVAALATGASICALQKSTSQQIPEVLKLTGDLEGVHDPAILKEGDIYYVYCTGGGRGGQGVIPIRTSKDLHNWTLAGYVLDKLPDWAATEIPAGRGAWAPWLVTFWTSCPTGRPPKYPRAVGRGRRTSPSTTASIISTTRSPRSAAGTPRLVSRPTRHSTPEARNTSGWMKGWFSVPIRTRTIGTPSIRNCSSKTRTTCGSIGEASGAESKCGASIPPPAKCPPKTRKCIPSAAATGRNPSADQWRLRLSFDTPIISIYSHRSTAVAAV